MNNNIYPIGERIKARIQAQEREDSAEERCLYCGRTRVNCTGSVEWRASVLEVRRTFERSFELRKLLIALDLA